MKILANFPHFSNQLHQPPKRRFQQSAAAACMAGKRPEVPGHVHFRSQVMHLVGQLVRHGFLEERRQQEVLHGVQGVRLVQASLVVVGLSEHILRSAGWRHRQRLGWRCLVYIRCDGDPSLMCLINRREEGRTGDL